MINIGYLRELNNKKLAELLEESRICNCTKSVTNWSETERKTNVEKGQMRRNPYNGRFWLILHVGEENGTHNWCLGLDEHGNVARLSINVVRTWILWDEEKEKNDDDVEKFLERICENL